MGEISDDRPTTDGYGSVEHAMLKGEPLLEPLLTSSSLPEE